MSGDRTDAKTIAGIRAGDVAAFERLFRLHYASLCRFAMRYVNDHAITEDLVQDLFTELWARRAHWAPRYGVRAYLFAAARNRALNVRKHDVIERDWAQAEVTSELREMPPQPDELFDAAQIEQWLSAAIAALPERCRMVMHLRWREQLSYAEIAEVMEISVKGVENQLSRGLRALRERLVE